MLKRIPINLSQSVARDLAILAVLAMALTVPFIGQAFHWDDRDFVAAAEVSAEDPTQFHLEDYSSRGLFKERFPIRHPPLLSTYLGLFIRIAGGVSEVLFHTVYLIFPLIAVTGMYALARRFTRYPLVAAMLFVFSSGFLLMSHTIMGNFPGTAFWVSATALFIYGVDRSDWRLLLGSGFVMALAVMTFAQGIILFPLLAFYALLKWKLFKPLVLLTFVFPAAVYLSWRLYIQNRYGFPPAISYQTEIRGDWQIRSLLVFLGGSILFPLSYLVFFIRRKIDFLVAFIVLPPLVAWASLYFISTGDLTTMQGIEVAVCVTAGALILYKLVYHLVIFGMNRLKRRRADDDIVFLAAWIVAGLSAYFLTSLPFVAVRHLLPIFPPVIIIFVRELDHFLPMRKKLRSALVGTVMLLTLAGGITASVADYRMASSYRSLAERLSDEYADAGVKKWALGEFDFRYYMEKQGFEYLGVNSEAKSGDLVMVSYVCSTGVVEPLPDGYNIVMDTFETDSAFPVRTMNPWAGAGFYGDLMGPLPFRISPARLDEITVSRLEWESQERGPE